MSRDPQVRFRAPDDLVTAVSDLAESEGISRSEAWRSLASQALADGAADLSHAAFSESVEVIKREEYPRKREAWFRANVGGRLLTDFNSGLRPEDAEKDLHGYRREAEELHDRDDFVQYVDEGLAVYADAYQRDASGLLKDWVKAKDAGQVPEGMPEGAARDVPADAQAVAEETDGEDDEEPPYVDTVEGAASWVESGHWGVEELTPPSRFDVSDETYQADIRRVLDADDPAAVDLEGEDQ